MTIRSVRVLDAPIPSTVPPSGAGEELGDLLNSVRSLIAPFWPLADMVAVNPLFGLVDRSFFAAATRMSELRDCDPLPSLELLRDAYRRGEFGDDDLRQALASERRRIADSSTPVGFDDLKTAVQSADLSTDSVRARREASSRRRVLTIAEAIDRADGTNLQSEIVGEISRWCASYFDLGQAAWPNPFRRLRLWDAWRATASVDRRFALESVPSFRDWVRRLPADPLTAIGAMLDATGLPQARRRDFLATQLLSIAGWASYVRRESFGRTVAVDEDRLFDLLAIRLAYDLALTLGRPPIPVERLLPIPDESSRRERERSALIRRLLLIASERGYRRSLMTDLISGSQSGATRGITSADASAQRATAQLVFCIDVRSEPLRRHLESTDSGIATFGFAGFFGLPLQRIGLGDTDGPHQCPVLLQPKFKAMETVSGDEHRRQEAIRGRRRSALRGKLAKLLASGGASAFPMVESFGLGFAARLIGRTFVTPRTAARPSTTDRIERTATMPVLPIIGPEEVELERRIDLAEGMLRNTGLVSGFARLVVFCGHTTEVTNNPLKAGLECGACGGHSGETNARVAAALLEDPQVRRGLAARGIPIPDDVRFVGGVHVTTTDEVRLFDDSQVAETHADDLRSLGSSLTRAAAAVRAERAAGFEDETPEGLIRRSRDWSEVRPEWGLAGNAAFVAAPRSRTRSIDLGGRVFLHSYDARHDTEGKTLELILTAPVVVAHWINLQYFASVTDPLAFGSGDKTLHNVIGRFGVLEGNTGDLRTGLALQSVSDGNRPRHLPLRLLVIVEATPEALDRVIARHPIVRDLVSGEWITLVSIADERTLRRTADGQWAAETFGSDEAIDHHRSSRRVSQPA